MPEVVRSSASKSILLLLFFALYFYTVGAGNMESLLNYPFWRDMGAVMTNDAFIELRQDHLWKVFPLLVVPLAALLIVTALLAWRGSPLVPRWMFVGALACQLVNVASTIVIQMPIQFRLTQAGFDAALLDRLIVTDLVFRKLPSLVEGVIVIWALWIVITIRRS